MAVAELSTGPRPTIAKPTLQNMSDLKGMSKARMRTSDGNRAQSKGDIERDIIKLLERPMTTGQIAITMKRTPKSLRRDYLAPMVKRGLLEQSGDYYKRPGTAEKQVERENFDDIAKNKAFFQLPCMKDFLAHCRTLNKGGGDTSWLTQAWKMCTGRLVPTFKCRPEHWTEQTSIAFIQAYRAHRNADRLPQEMRQLLRYFHEYVLHKPVTDGQKNLWGVDGTKDNAGIYNHVKLTPEQRKQIYDFYMDKGDLEAAAYFAFGTETFGRSEAVFLAANGTMRLKQRTLEYVQVAGSSKRNFDAIAVEQGRIVAALHPNLMQVKTVQDEVYSGTLREFKTDHAPWPKYIVDPQAVAIFKEYEATRKGKPRYFGRDGESFKRFNKRISAQLRLAYHEFGLIPSITAEPPKLTAEWYMWDRPAYSLRHFGAHIWLERLGGSYEALSEMGWEDAGIPKKFYAGYNAHLLDQRIARTF